MDDSPLNDNEKKHKSNEGSSPTLLLYLLPPTHPSSPHSVCTVVPDMYQGSGGRQRGPSTAVAFLCLLGDGGPDSSAA